MNQFDRVPIKIPAKNVFTLDHDIKSTYTFDKLYPFLCQPVYPGDTFNCRAEVFMRAMPLLAPVMHNVDLKMYFFFVPMRLVWNENKKRDWKVFITGGEDGMQNPVLPYFTYKDLYQAGNNSINLMSPRSLLDHMGFQVIRSVQGKTWDDSNQQRVCSLPFRAYQLVWNEYFRNQNLQNEIEFSYDANRESIADLKKLFVMRSKCYEKDYFTSCLPFEQRGQVVNLPIDLDGGFSADFEAPVSVDKAQVGGVTGLQTIVGSDNAVSLASAATLTGNVTLKGTATIDASEIAFSGISVGSINDFRYCLRLQQWLENNARCGSRYIEQLLAHFGVTSSDARLQRPELLGGGSIPLIFSDVEQNSFGDGGTDSNVLGNLGGKGTLYGKTNGFKKYFEEHGILLGLLTIIPRTSYSCGLPRVWTAMDKTDWYFPEFAHLGEQAVLNKEIFYSPFVDETLPDGVFGYQGRFTELRYIPSSIHGDMLSSLQYWHYGRIFDDEPALNESFVEASTPLNSFALLENKSGSEDPFVCQIHMDISAVRPLPKFAVPTL